MSSLLQEIAQKRKESLVYEKQAIEHLVIISSISMSDSFLIFVPNVMRIGEVGEEPFFHQNKPP